MSRTYKYNRLSSHHYSIRPVLVVLGITILIAAAIAGVFVWKNQKHQQTIQSKATYVAQAVAKQTYEQINEPFFSFKLPSDWKQTGSQDAPSVHSITWQATLKDEDNRYLTMYIDTIPSTYAVNRELPVTAHGNQLSYGALSDNCSSFTPGGTYNTAQAESLKPAPSVWQGVNFICNLPQVIDNQVGAGSPGAVNSVTVTGPTAGTHSYFFLYIDRNIQPDYTILYDMLQSFRAK